MDDIWRHFRLFNESQLAALAPEHEDPNMGWYNRFARHPFYGKMGLNSGVMLMNLTRMREFQFTSKFFPLYLEYKYNITWGDQCLLNILFHYHPGLWILLSIRINNEKKDFSHNNKQILKINFICMIVRGTIGLIIVCMVQIASKLTVWEPEFYMVAEECFTMTKNRLFEPSIRCLTM